jgi:hypothetical protein
MPKTRNQERSRDAGQTPLELVEVAAAEQELANDQWRPTVGKNLACASNWAVLVILEHAPIVLHLERLI